ncbi:hypothetical protein Tco_0226696 [Tanacetum coccineum]
MESVKKSIGERAQHKMEYESRVNERQIQTTEEKTDTSNALDALDASSVIIESNGTESKEQDTSSRSGNDSHADDADIRPISDKEIEKKELEAHYGFMAKIQEVLPAESSSTDTPLEQVQNNDEKNVFANERQHSEKHAAECANERAALANLIANLTLDTEENKTILKQLKKANTLLTQELEK